LLDEFLSENRAIIIARARTKVAARAAPRATAEEFENGIPLFLNQLIEVLRQPDSSRSSIESAASGHGRARLDRGFTIAQVVHDYGDLCDAVTELAVEMKLPISATEFHVFNRCLDDAIAQAVTEYAGQRDRSIAEEGRARSGELTHELRNALGAATLAFDLVTTGKVAPRGSTAAVLGRSLVRMTQLVNSSIAETRLDAGIRASERVSVAEFIEEVEVSASMEANARGLTLSVGSVEPGVTVKVDRQLLTAAVANLLQNAFKFTRPNSHVLLQTSQIEGRVLISVEDECGGLPAGLADELFRPFEQRSRNRAGLGLGLWISRRSVEADGGQLYVRDITGIGCVFTVDLPRF
jgi:signal transduction histidine kinase